MKKRVLAILLALVMCLALLHTAALAASSFTINGVTVTVSSGTNPGDCSDYASSILKKIWPEVYKAGIVMTTFNNSYNMLKDLDSTSRKVSTENVKKYIQAAPLGSRIRICTTSDTTSNDFDNGTGHTMVLVDKNDAAGKFTVLEGGQGNPPARAREYTYQEFVSAKTQHKPNTYPDYFYFYYIADYSAAANGVQPTTPATNPDDFEIKDSVYVHQVGKTQDGVLIKYKGKGGDVVIPDGVTCIWENAFQDCTGLTSVTISNSVTSIDSSAFRGCTGLLTFSVDTGNRHYASKDGVLFTRDMKTLVTYPCGKEGAYTIPSSVTTIGRAAFINCSGLSNVTIPNSVTSIESDAFARCESLTSVTIPDSVTSIESGWVFAFCTSLREIKVDAKNKNYISVDGVLFTKDMKTLVAYPVGKKGSYSIPNSVTNIEASAFNGCRGLNNVTIPESVTSIGKHAFQSTGLTNVTISKNVTSIGWGAFNASRLVSVTIENGIPFIDGYVFSCRTLKDIYFTGTEAQWKAIKIEDSGNDPLKNATIHYNSPMPDQPTTPTTPAAPATATADPTNDKLTVNGSTPNATIYKIGGNNYFKLRDVAAMLNGTGKQFNVGYDTATKSANIITGQGYTKEPTDLLGAAASSQTATLSNDSVLLNGKRIEATVYKIGGNNYFKLRDLGQALDFYVGWNAQDGAFIDTSKPYSE